MKKGPEKGGGSFFLNGNWRLDAEEKEVHSTRRSLPHNGQGNNRSRVFYDDEDYEKYLNLMSESREKYAVSLYRYALMTNHFHIILRAGTGEHLSGFVKRVNVGYVNHYRNRYKGIGHFFQDRFKSCLIQRGSYMLECGRYVELNPVRAGIAEDPADYRWSSYATYAGPDEVFNDIVEPDPEYLGLSDDEKQRRKLYGEYVRSGRDERRNEERYFRTGVYGSEEYLKSLKEKGLKPEWSHKGRPNEKGDGSFFRNGCWRSDAEEKEVHSARRSLSRNGQGK